VEFGAATLEMSVGPNAVVIALRKQQSSLSNDEHLNGILKLLLLIGPGTVLPPIERSVQVGTILEPWFWRNSIFAAFPVITQITISSSHCLPTETVRESRIFKEF